MASQTHTDQASPNPTHSLNQLPDEVLNHILYYLTPHDISHNIQRTSKRFNRLGREPLLWRYHCRVEFKHWDEKHHIRRKFLGSVAEVDWKELYTYRRNIDFETTKLLDSILERQTSRIAKFNAIGKFGYDAKDALLRHCDTSEDAEDVLARRYYANDILDHLHRSKAVGEWVKLLNGEDVPLERALGAFDLFVLHDQKGDLLEIEDILDGLASQFRKEVDNLDQLTTRKKAVATAQFLRDHNFIGLNSEIAYRDLQNNYIGIALQGEDHPSLPLISVAIYCGLSKRLGLDARCCGIPNNVHAMVYPPANETVDGRPWIDQPMPSEPMYLDPYRTSEEIPVQSLKTMLSQWGIHRPQFPEFLASSTASSVVLRASRNILATVHEFRAHGTNTSTENNGHPTISLHGNPFADLDNAFYSALWANYIFSSSSRDPSQTQFIPLILERFERLYPMDASLISTHILPFYNDPSIAIHGELREGLRVVKLADQTPKQVRKRDNEEKREGVRWKVGQVFRHRRYGYLAVITGWDVECGMGSEWMRSNLVDSLSRGRWQSFYHALPSSVEDTSIRYVAEENIEIVTPENPTSLMSLAGRYFKRWDKEERRFVSNIRDEYPED